MDIYCTCCADSGTCHSCEYNARMARWVASDRRRLDAIESGLREELIQRNQEFRREARRASP